MNLQESIRRILREETELPINLRRRLSTIDDHVTYSVFKRIKECGRFDSDLDFLTYIIGDVIEDMYFTHFGDIESPFEVEKIYIAIENYITKKFGESIKNTYHINCGK
jgi:hypothetical protein